MPNGQELVANPITSKVTKSGAKKASFSILLGQGSKGIIFSEFYTKA
jgi:hypothetical protein